MSTTQLNEDIINAVREVGVNNSRPTTPFELIDEFPDLFANEDEMFNTVYSIWPTWEHMLFEAGLISKKQAETAPAPFVELCIAVREVLDINGGDRNPTLYQVCDAVPTLGGYQHLPDNPEDVASAYAHYFDSWSSVLSGVKVGQKNREIPKEELCREAKRVYQEIGELTQTGLKEHSLYSFKPFDEQFDGMDDIRETTGVEHNVKLPREELLTDIKRVAKDIGRPPSTVDINNNGKFSHSTYLSRGEWDDWDDVLNAAGLA